MTTNHLVAIDMPWVELEHGGTPDMRRMPQELILTQQHEIEALRNWMPQHPAR